MSTLTTVNSDQYADAYVSEPSVKLDVSIQHGRVRRAYGAYTIDSADEFGTAGLINLFKLPKGARIIDARTIAPAAGANGQYEVGWDAGTSGLETPDADGIFGTQDPGDAAVDARMLGTANGYNRKLLDEVTVQLDVTEASADSGGDTWEVEVHYVLD